MKLATVIIITKQQYWIVDYFSNNNATYNKYEKYDGLDENYISSFVVIFINKNLKRSSGIIITNLKGNLVSGICGDDYDHNSGKLVNTISFSDIDYTISVRKGMFKRNYTISESIIMRLQSAALAFNLLKMHPEYFTAKIIRVQSKKKSSKFVNVNEYIFDSKYFAHDYIGDNYSMLDRVVIPDNYQEYDPNNYLKPVFPLQDCVILSEVKGRMCVDYDGNLISSNNTDISISVVHVNKNMLSIKSWSASEEDGSIIMIIDCIYNLQLERMVKVIYPNNDNMNLEYALEAIKDDIKIWIDIFKYMSYHADDISKKDVIIGSIEGSSNYTSKANDKPRFETNMCSRKVYGITKKVIPVTEAEAKEKRKYTPCQYAVTVKGHFRHYKSGKVIWVENFIRNKDKEFKPKDYVDKKH